MTPRRWSQLWIIWAALMMVLCACMLVRETAWGWQLYFAVMFAVQGYIAYCEALKIRQGGQP